MRKLSVVLLLSIVFHYTGRADEGMWLLNTLRAMNIIDMQDRGLQLTAEDICNANGNSLKDAIVIFGGGCTGEIVSPEGLLFTNHHCGYGSIQSLSSVEHDYLRHGYWAMDRSQELPAPGLTVTFIRHMEDVTDRILKGVRTAAPADSRDQAIARNKKRLLHTFEKEGRFDGMELQVEEFYGGNRYIMFATETYRDIRLVGAPPTSIGKFGGDTDNWMWPRHTGDFSVFRVYGGKDGRPANYSRDNIPYRSPVHLKISLNGYQQGDYTMIMGFPGSTDRYMTSYELDEMLSITNPVRIHVRGIRQDILREAMASSDEIRIKYASKYAASTNYWKNAIGMSRGIERLSIRAVKERQQEAFMRWVAGDRKLKKLYGESLTSIKDAVRDRAPYYRTQMYISEAMLRSVEIIRAVGLLFDFDGRYNIPQQELDDAARGLADFYKDYDSGTDRRVTKAMLAILRDSVGKKDMQMLFDDIDSNYGGDIGSYVDNLFDKSMFSDYGKVKEYLEEGNFSNLKADPAFSLRNSLLDAANKNAALRKPFGDMFRDGHRLYVAGVLEMDNTVKHYPDANFTIRLTYGSVRGYSPADGVMYDYYTDLSGVIAKENPDNPEEFTVPEKLKELYDSKDFGPYSYMGDIPVCFISDNDITGGNSGSPVLNARGELLGLAFDGNWEAMSGDIVFEPAIQRCINVDIRYVLFIIDKFAGASYLLDELTIVN